jgi:hypothetical protein
MRPNFGKALTGLPVHLRGPRNKAEQWVGWKQALDEWSEYERCFTMIRDICTSNILVDLIASRHYKDIYKEGNLETELANLTKNTNDIFDAMHRIAYIEGLLNAENTD